MDLRLLHQRVVAGMCTCVTFYLRLFLIFIPHFQNGCTRYCTMQMSIISTTGKRLGRFSNFSAWFISAIRLLGICILGNWQHHRYRINCNVLVVCHHATCSTHNEIELLFFIRHRVTLLRFSFETDGNLLRKNNYTVTVYNLNIYFLKFKFNWNGNIFQCLKIVYNMDGTCVFWRRKIVYFCWIFFSSSIQNFFL